MNLVVLASRLAPGFCEIPALANRQPFASQRRRMIQSPNRAQIKKAKGTQAAANGGQNELPFFAKSPGLGRQ
jgi:hypothetical protein